MGAELDDNVGRTEQPPDLAFRRPYASGHRSEGEVPGLHRQCELPGQHTLRRDGNGLLAGALPFQEILEAGPMCGFVVMG